MVWSKKSEVAAVNVTSRYAKEKAAETKSGRADLNDMPRFNLKPGVKGSFRFTVNGEAREIAFGPLEKESVTIDAIWPDLMPVQLTE
jgi:hypothetical protein